MGSYQTVNSVSLSILINIIIKCIIESLVCFCTIVLNILIITSLLGIKRLRTTQHFLLINVSFACIFFSLSCIISISLTMSTLYSKTINSYICQLIGFIVISSCHCLMFSYTLVTFIRFLTIIYPFNKKITSIQYIKIYLIIKWILAFILPGISLILPNQQIIFQPKARLCTISQQSPILFISFCTGYIIPLILISSMNLITYINVACSRQILGLSQTKLTRLNKRKRRNLRLLRQFSLFTIIFLFGWTPFILIEVIDKEEKLSDIFYLYTLILPSICILIDSSVILHWNKTIYQQIQLWKQILLRKTEIINDERDYHVTTHEITLMSRNS
ncbi:unnamed protein product [Adineta steineri]|uniref:G-protein coupled receptors family 1 profile domain-containing protein n=2 Tax=Adineta steineri TaxID=433720 RepID=A0A813YC55_9BILA|nr:unnamed protein product [Adineta steineri]